MTKTQKAPAKPAAPTLTDKEVAARNKAALERVASMDDPDKLRNLMANAARMGVDEVRDAAFRRLALIQTAEAPGDGGTKPGSVAHDFWQTIFATEQLMREDRGKAVRLTKTRQKISRVGEVKALSDFAEATKDTGGFEMLMARDMPELTGEAIILRHPDDFDADVQATAKARLEAAGVDVAALTG